MFASVWLFNAEYCSPFITDSSWKILTANLAQCLSWAESFEKNVFLGDFEKTMWGAKVFLIPGGCART